jgi:hypothetical protein
MASEAEEKLAREAQDGARKHYAKGARGAIAAGFSGSYTVQPGDTYESIADAVYGDEAYGADIFDASLSAGAVSSNRRTELPGGTVLVLPVVAADSQPSAKEAADVAADSASRRPVGDRAGTTAAPTGRVGGVGDARKPDAPSRSTRSRSSSRTAKRSSSRSRPSRARRDTPAATSPAPAPAPTPAAPTPE